MSKNIISFLALFLIATPIVSSLEEKPPQEKSQERSFLAPDKAVSIYTKNPLAYAITSVLVALLAAHLHLFLHMGAAPLNFGIFNIFNRIFASEIKGQDWLLPNSLTVISFTGISLFPFLFSLNLSIIKHLFGSSTYKKEAGEEKKEREENWISNRSIAYFILLAISSALFSYLHIFLRANWEGIGLNSDNRYQINYGLFLWMSWLGKGGGWNPIISLPISAIINRWFFIFLYKKIGHALNKASTPPSDRPPSPQVEGEKRKLLISKVTCEIAVIIASFAFSLLFNSKEKNQSFVSLKGKNLNEEGKKIVSHLMQSLISALLLYPIAFYLMNVIIDGFTTFFTLPQKAPPPPPEPSKRNKKKGWIKEYTMKSLLAIAVFCLALA